MKQIPNLPKCRILKQVSPSTASDLAECMYKAGQKKAPELKDFFDRSPPALIGTLAHRVIERAFTKNSRLQSAVSEVEDPKEIARKIWNEELQNLLKESNILDRLGHPISWPQYGMKRARTINMATEIIRKSSQHDYDYSEAKKSIIGLERKIEGPSGKIVGRPDRICEENSGIAVEDFKTGSIRDDSGEIRQQYRRQILIYSWLVEKQTDRWPQIARLVPLEGASYEERPERDEAENIVENTLDLLDKYNQIIEDTNGDSNAQASRLANPSADSCRWCRVRPWCDPFWDSPVPKKLSSEYREDIQGKLKVDWSAPRPMHLVGEESGDFVLGINPGTGGAEKKLQSQTLVRCINAQINEEGESYLADSDSELWWKKPPDKV